HLAGGYWTPAHRVQEQRGLALGEVASEGDGPQQLVGELAANGTLQPRRIPRARPTGGACEALGTNLEHRGGALRQRTGMTSPCPERGLEPKRFTRCDTP